MALEITSAGSISCGKNQISVGLSAQVQRDLTGVGMYSGVQQVGTSAELVTFPGDLTTEGITEIHIRNLDATNYIEIGGDSGQTVFKCKIPALGYMKFYPSSGNPTLYAKANTAACNIGVVAVGT